MKMKIQCDVCCKKEGTVFCSADEAALCDGCDQRVHHANKLASKHQRFSLFQPSLAPLCDICQEKRALIFCLEDRAILCNDCELPLHKANEHTQKHNRFLLTCTKLSALRDTSSGINKCYPETNFKSSKNPSYNISSSSVSSSGLVLTYPSSDMTMTTNSVYNNQLVSRSSTSSSVSEYLVDMLPEMRFQDFEDASFSFYKMSGTMNGYEADGDTLLSMDVDLDKKTTYSSASSNILSESSMGIRLPQAPATAVASTAKF